jgi:hypothetical protein
MNFATVITLLIVLALVVVAVFSLRKGNGCCKKCRDTRPCISTSNDHCNNCNYVSCPFKR